MFKNKLLEKSNYFDFIYNYSNNYNSTLTYGELFNKNISNENNFNFSHNLHLFEENFECSLTNNKNFYLTKLLEKIQNINKKENINRSISFFEEIKNFEENKKFNLCPNNK